MKYVIGYSTDKDGSTRQVESEDEGGQGKNITRLIYPAGLVMGGSWECVFIFKGLVLLCKLMEATFTSSCLEVQLSYGKKILRLALSLNFLSQTDWLENRVVMEQHIKSHLGNLS